jgi:hypothetical protein
MILPRGPLISAGPAASSRFGQAHPISPAALVRRRVATRMRILDCLNIYVPDTRVARIVRQSLMSSELCPLLLPSLNLHCALMGHHPSHFFHYLSQGTAVLSVSPSEQSAGSSSSMTPRKRIQRYHVKRA